MSEAQRLALVRRGLVAREENLQLLLTYVESKGGRVLNARPVVKHDRVSVVCGIGHEWNVQVGSLIGLATWCPRCAGNFPRTLSELEAIVSGRGGKLLTRDYRGVDGTYDFECNLGHSFSNMFKKVENGQWCPTCSKGSKSEEIARTTLEQLFEAKFPRKKPQWLKNSRGFQMELDGYNEGLQLAFEYQGYQHFEKDHWGTDLSQRQEDDEHKRQVCIENSVLLLELSHNDSYSDFPQVIREQLLRSGFDCARLDFNRPIDLSMAYIRNDRLEDFRKLLADKDIELLSNAWLGTNESYEMRCLVCGHTWEAKGNSFFNSRGATGCNSCARQEPGNKQDISVLLTYAAKNGGKLLSSEYVRRNHTYEWECGQGHRFSANFNNLKFRNQFCPICESRMIRLRLDQGEAESQFREFGFALLAEYRDKGTYHRVECLSCQGLSTKSLEMLQQGRAKCRSCVLKQQEMAALELLKSRQIKPLEPFSGNSHKWRCECLVCHNIITPMVSNLSKSQGGCIHCYKNRRRGPFGN